MDSAVKPQPELSHDEWVLLAELLERKRNELPAEIHHTRTSAVRQQLRERREMIDRLLERLRSSSET